MIDDPKEVAKFEKQWHITAGAHKRTKKVAKLSSARGKKRTKRRIIKRRKGISHAAAVKRARKAWRTRLAKSRGRKVTMAKRGRKRARKRTYRRRTKRVVTRHARMRSQFYRPKRRIKRGSLKRRKKYMIAAYKHRGHLYTSPRARRVWPNHRLNPFGSEMMTIGANPRRRKRRRSRKSYKSNPRRRYMARGRRRFSRNPLASMRHLLPMIAAGTAGALATRNLPRML